MVIYSHAIHVAVMSEYCVKRVNCTNWAQLCAGTLANSADLDQMPHNTVSPQDLHGLLKLQAEKC